MLLVSFLLTPKALGMQQDALNSLSTHVWHHSITMKAAGCMCWQFNCIGTKRVLSLFVIFAMLIHGRNMVVTWHCYSQPFGLDKGSGAR